MPGEPLMVKANAGAVLGALLENDLRFEIMFQAFIEILKEKKNPDGTPFFSSEEWEARAKTLMAQAKAEGEKIISPKSSIIIPGK